MAVDEHRLAMFPLGSTVFPGQLIPLHVFEERYQQLLTDLTDDDAEATFGTVLIDRGHEVGGGDHRVDVGTRVQILRAERFDDGRWAVIAAGVERIEVKRWLEDDPYPMAVVTSRRIIDNGGGSLDDLEQSVFATVQLAAQVAASGAVELPELSADPLERLDQLAALSPLSEYDRQRLLEATTTSDLITLLDAAVVERQLVLGAQLGGS